MSLKGANSLAIIAYTTGAGIALGTNIDLGGIYIGPTASTVTVISNGTTSFQTTASVGFTSLLALNGPVTATSSGGSFWAAVRNR